MLQTSFLCFDKVEMQFSMGFSAQKFPKPDRNSHKAEILYIGAIEYVFQYPRAFLKIHAYFDHFLSNKEEGSENFDFSTVTSQITH